MTEAAELSPRARASSATRFRPDIQGLRAIAVLLVVIYHAGVALPGGFVGVDVFFVVSGYVITRMLTTELGNSGRVDLRRFYLRRIRRLLPALAVMLGVVLLASILLAPLGGQEPTARTGATAALFNANTYLIRSDSSGYFDASADLNALLHTWSLSVEEQFYLVFPALLFLAWMIGRRLPPVGTRLALGITLGAVVSVSFLASWTLSSGRLDPSEQGADIAFYSAPTRAWEFAFGGLIALGATFVARLPGRAGTVLAVIGVALLGWSAVALDGGTTWPGTAALLPVFGTALLLAAGEPRQSNPLNRLLEARPLGFLGDISYSWYLWHWPLIVFAAALWPQASDSAKPAAAMVSLAAAWLSYRWVESPIRLRPRPRVLVTVTLAASCMVVPVIAAGVLEVGSREPRGERLAPFGMHADVLQGCNSYTPIGDRDLSTCQWAGPDGDTGLGVLIGDSNAGHFTEGFVSSMYQTGMEALVATIPSCPFVDLLIARYGVANTACHQFVSESVRDLLDMQPDLVMIASASDQYIDSDEFALSDGSGSPTSDALEKALLWDGGLQRVVSALESGGISVAIVHPVPRVTPWDPRACSELQWRRGGCNASVPRSQAEQRRERALAAERAAVGSTSAIAVDPFDRFCPGSECWAFDGERWLFMDSHHITVEASQSLTDMFSGLVAAE